MSPGRQSGGGGRQQLDDWLERNLISRDAYEAAKSDNLDDFLRLRAQTIHRAVLELAGWAATEPDELPSSEVADESDEAAEAAAADEDYTVEEP